MVKTTYGIVGKDVGVSNEKCGIKVLTFQQVVESTSIIVPKFQRDIQDDKVNDIIKQYKEHRKTCQNYFIKHGYTICLCKIGKQLYIIDGQHRYNALKHMYEEGYRDNILVRVQICESINDMKSDFAQLNINSNIPIVYTYFENEFVQEIILNLKKQLKEEYGSCFSRAQSTATNRMHIDEFMNLFDMDYVKGLYLKDNNINIMNLLRNINVHVKQMINEKQIERYITKSDYRIINNCGFYLSLKNIEWNKHFICDNKQPTPYESLYIASILSMLLKKLYSFFKFSKCSFLSDLLFKLI